MESDLSASPVVKDRVVIVRQCGEGQTFREVSSPDDFALEVFFPENLIEHHLHVMRSVPVAVVVEAAGLLEHAGEFDAARAHVVDVGAGVLVPVLEGALLLGLAPEDFVVAVRVERRVDVDEVDAAVR